jgi:hypothetical protein
MTVGELRRMLEGLGGDTPVVIATYDEDGPSDHEYGPADAKLMTAIRLHRRKCDHCDEWVRDSEENLTRRAQQPRTREQVLLVW